ncbi:MAG: hypothetical protein ABWY28_21980 [Pseudomonas prosekii]
MTSVVQNLIKPSFTAAFNIRALRNQADKFERDQVIRQLRAVIVDPRAFPIDWSEHDIDLRPGSSLYNMHMPGSSLLRKLTDQPFIQQHSVRLFLKPLVESFVNSDGSLFIRGDHWEPITDIANSQPSSAHTLKCLVEVAKRTGGLVSSTNKVEIAQWMKFHELNVPTHFDQNKNLLDFLTFNLPTPDDMGNYWSQLLTTEPGGAVMTSDQQAAMRSATAKLLPRGKKLLDKLHEDVLHNRLARWDQAAQSIKSLVSHPSSRMLARQYIDELGWYGANNNVDEPLNDADLEQLLVSAILLDLQSTSPTADPLGSFNLYSPDKVDWPHFLARQELEAYLTNNQRVSAAAAPLAVHLLLAHVAPEFLILQLPSTPLLGSIGWVTLSRTVALIESQALGASRLMTFDQVMEYAGFESIGPSQEKLSALAAIDPIINWAALNQVITREAWQKSGLEALQKATSAYQLYLEQLSQAASAFGAAPPSRKAFARQQLEKILPNCDHLESEVLTYAGTRWQGEHMSMLELHMSGDLVHQHWNNPAGDIFKKHPNLITELSQLTDDFQVPVRAYQQQLSKALVTNLKLALAQLDEDDQRELLRNQITFYTVRPTAAFETKAPVALNGRVGLEYFTTVETQQAIDAATGHYGVVMCISNAGKTTCYELFSLHGKCLKNPQLADAIDSAALWNSPSRIDFSGDIKSQMSPAPVHLMPLDIRNYTHGSEPSHQTTSHVVLDKLGVLAAPTSTTSRMKGTYQRFHYPHFERIAQFIAEHRPLATYAELKEVAAGETKYEKLTNVYEERSEFMLNLIIPFRSCIQDLASGERVRVAQGVFGCLMDAIAVVGGIVGAVSKIAAIMSRTVSSCSRVASTAKQLLILAIGTFNPLDGLNSYAAHGAKLFFKGGLRLNSVGIEVVAKARTQIHRLTKVADSYDVVRASNRADLAQGTWIAKDNSEAINLWASRSRNSTWHAINRFGRPWGEALNNFRSIGDIRLPRFDKQLPALYTGTVIDSALSTARLKIDRAITVLSHANHRTDVGKIVSLLLGESSIAAVNSVLMAQKSYYSAVSLRNFLLADQSVSQDMLAFDPEAFRAWQTAGSLQSEKQFISVFCADLNQRFVESDLNEGVIADDLIRMLLHAGTGILDLSVALPMPTSNAGAQQLDVAPLLNLASGHYPVAGEGVSGRFHDRTEALKNADSWAVLTSLLSQLDSDPMDFDGNVSQMNAALQASRQGGITRAVSISLNRI